MEFFRVFLSVGISLTFLCQNVHHYRFVRSFGFFKCTYESLDIVSVDDSDIFQIEQRKRAFNPFASESFEIIRDKSDVFRNAHFVVVQHDYLLVSRARKVVERFVSQPARHGSVADKRDDLFIAAKRPCQTARYGNRSRSVPCVGDVVFTFLRFREARNTFVAS